MRKNKKIINMQQYKQKSKWNLGSFLFGIIFIYLFITVITYVTKDRILVYEVKEGSIQKDITYQGIAIRDEEVVHSGSDGYINFFKEGNSKVAANKNVYAISNEKLIEDNKEQKNEEVELTSDEWDKILLRAQNFNQEFSPNNYRRVYELKENTGTIVESNTTQNRVDQLQAILDAGASAYSTVYKAEKEGLIEYNLDGYEDFGVDEVVRHFSKPDKYKKTEIKNNMKIKAGDPAYRLITNEKWSVVVKIDKDTKNIYKEQLDKKEKIPVKVRFLKDNQVMWGKLGIVEENRNGIFANIDFDNSVVRYAQDRFLDLELIFEDKMGLKIPKSAVAKKDFFVIPNEYLTKGGAGNESGVFLEEKTKKGELVYEFQPVEIFAQDVKNKCVYVKINELKKGDTILLPASGEDSNENSRQKLTLKETVSRPGVYTVNKGYAEFKDVEILCESDEYYIVKEGTNYGLSNYDFIALDGDEVQEDAIVSQ